MCSSDLSLCVVLGGWFVSEAGDTPQAGILSLRPGGKWDEIIPGAYVLVFAVVVLATAGWLTLSDRRRPRAAWSGAQPGSLRGAGRGMHSYQP